MPGPACDVQAQLQQQQRWIADGGGGGRAGTAGAGNAATRAGRWRGEGPSHVASWAAMLALGHPASPRPPC